MTMFASHFVVLILGHAWTSSGQLMPVLAWAGVAMALSNVMTGFLQAVGRPNLPVRSAIISAGVLAIAVYPAALSFGLKGVALVTAVASLVSLAYQAALLNRTLCLTYRDWLATCRIGVIASAPILGAGLFASQPPTGIDFLMALVALGACAAVLTSAIPNLSNNPNAPGQAPSSAGTG
jgi:stage V sporulation protein B